LSAARASALVSRRSERGERDSSTLRRWSVSRGGGGEARAVEGNWSATAAKTAAPARVLRLGRMGGLEWARTVKRGCCGGMVRVLGVKEKMEDDEDAEVNIVDLGFMV